MKNIFTTYSFKKNKIMKSYLLLIVILGLCMQSCYKDIVEFDPDDVIGEPPVEITGDVDDFYAKVPDFSITSIIKNDETVFIVTENQTIIEIPANSFELPGSDLDAADIQFTYTELHNPAEFAFYGLPTISGGTLLKTEGVFLFEARSEGKEIMLKEGKSIKVRLPVDNPNQKAKLFIAEGEGENFNWNEDTAGPNGNENFRINEWSLDSIEGVDEFISGYGYEFECDLWNWINVDIFVDIPEEERTSVCVELPEIYTDKNTLVLMHFIEIESILALHPDSDKMQFCEPYGATPIGYKVNFIVISSQGEDVFHFALQDAKIEKDHVEYIEPKEKSIEDIIDILKNL